MGIISLTSPQGAFKSVDLGLQPTIILNLRWAGPEETSRAAMTGTCQSSKHSQSIFLFKPHYRLNGTMISQSPL